MRPPWLVRVHSADPAVASAIERELAERGAPARVEPGAAGEGASADIAVLEADGPKWLAPVPLPSEPAQATSALVSFLEAWGFLSRRVAS